MNISCDDECLFFLKKALSEQMFFFNWVRKTAVYHESI
jgi:hypothetical protein